MRTARIEMSDWRGVFPVPPLARRRDKARTIDLAENDRLVRHLIEGGMSRLLYGGNAFLYHVTLSEYQDLLAWLAALPDPVWAIPSAGPSFGRLIDQATILRRYRFPAVMQLPCGDPRDAAGIEAGLRDFVEASATPLIVYIKDEGNLGADRAAGIEAAARLVRDGVCIGIKYAVIRRNPAEDPYLTALLERVDRRVVLSGIGERPAIAHLRDFGLPGFTTGSGCVAPAMSNQLLAAIDRKDFEEAERIRQLFLPHENLRDAWGPARVLHASVDLAGLMAAGPIPPFVSELSAERRRELEPVAKKLAVQTGRRPMEEPASATR